MKVTAVTRVLFLFGLIAEITHSRTYRDYGENNYFYFGTYKSCSDVYWILYLKHDKDDNLNSVTYVKYLTSNLEPVWCSKKIDLSDADLKPPSPIRGVTFRECFDTCLTIGEM